VSKQVIVIGAGFGGLSAASYLAKSGYEVTVIEKNSQPGGRAMVNKAKGFVFDLGPSWYLMPDVFDEFFADFGHKTSDFYELIDINPSYKVFDEKRDFEVKTAPDAYELFEDLEPGSSEEIKKLLQKTQKEYETVRKRLLIAPQVSFKEALTNPEAIKFLANPELNRSYHSRIKKYAKSPELQRILEFMTVFMGGSPENIPAMYSLLAHVDLGLGVKYPIGGMGSLVEAFAEVAKEQGVRFVYNAEVDKILTSKSLSKGVITKDGDVINADIVVANADYMHVETSLLERKDQKYPRKYWDKKTISPSGLLIYMGIGKKLPNLLHHNLFFDTDWHGHFSEVFEKKVWSENPLIYVCAPSKSDRTVAPKGKENIFVLAPMANGDQPSKERVNKTVDSIIKRIEKRISTEFKDDIEYIDVRAHDYFKETFNAYKGNAFGLAHTFMQSGPLRPKMQSPKVKNLYYVGQYTNPGTGVPLVTLSGKAVSRLIEANK
jgi:phytoene desaturase